MANSRAAQDADDAAALALELWLAKRASAPIRTVLAALTAALLIEAAKGAAASPDGQIPPKTQAVIRALVAAKLAKLTLDVGAAVASAATAGIRLAMRQERAVLRDLDIPLPPIEKVTADVLADPVLARAGHDAQQALAAELHRIREFAATAPLRTEKQVAALAARAGGGARVVERDVRTATNRALNTTTWQLARTAGAFAPAVAPPRPPLETRIIRQPATQRPAAEPAAEPAPTATSAPPGAEAAPPPGEITPDLRVVWIAERGACLTCLALSGQTADPSRGTWFDEFATFDCRPMPVWPPDQPLMGPPRHPHCRCRLRIIAATNTMLPAALAREARRSVARGFSDHASRLARLGAADRLLAAGMRLPVTVEHRAAQDVARGAFSTRHRPRVPELRADQPRTSPRGRTTR